MGGHAGHTAHDVDAELQPQGVHIVCQGLEACAVCSGREAVHGGEEAAILVHRQGREGLIGVVDGGGLVPLDVHHDVLPAIGPEMLGHVFRILADDILGDGSAVAVPAVPAHGRMLCDHLSYLHNGRMG